MTAWEAPKLRQGAAGGASRLLAADGSPLQADAPVDSVTDSCNMVPAQGFGAGAEGVPEARGEIQV